MNTRLGTAALAAYLLGVLALGQRGGEAPAERDALYHARYAQLLPSRGLSRSFPWTRASTWRDRFCDKELLYHVLLVPFTRDERAPLRGAQAATVLLGLAFFGTLLRVLRSQSVPWAPLLAAAPAAMGGPFLLRMSFVRPHVLAVALAVAGMGLLLRRRWTAVFWLGFAFSWSYSFPLVLFFIALPLALGRRLAGERLEWDGLAAALGGVSLGLILHPYSPNSLESLRTYFEVLRLALEGRARSGIGLGREFAPYSTRAFLQAYPLMTAAAAAIPLAGWLSGRRPRADALGAYCAALFWLAVAAVYARAAEYAAPLAVVAAALALRDHLREGGKLGPRAKAAGLAVLAAAHAWTLAYYLPMTSAEDPPRFAGAARWMEANLAPGETVANLWWDDFPDLFYCAPRQSYLVGLDPTYMLRWDAEKALRLEAMRLGTAPLDAAWLASAFGARHLVLRADAARFYPQLASGAWRPAYADAYAAVYPLQAR